MARATSLIGKINGTTNAYLGNSRRHQLVKGNKLGTHNKVYRQIRKKLGISAG